MEKIKLFEEYQNSIKKWSNKIIKDDKFYSWFDKNEDSEELKDGYNEYLSNLDENENPSTFIEWVKTYYNNL